VHRPGDRRLPLGLRPRLSQRPAMYAPPNARVQLMSARDELAAKGITLPSPPKPGGAYEAVRIMGGIAYVAIQFPILNGEWVWRGRLGQEISTEDGYQAARLCALNVLAQLDRLPGLDRIAGLNRIEAHMLTAPGWNDFARVVDGASHLFLEALGDVGCHSRALYGVERLPGNATIALTTTATLRFGDGDRGA